MYLHITPIEDIAKEIENMQEYLDQEVSGDPNLCVERGEKLMTYSSRAGKLLSDAQYYRDAAIQNSILKEAGAKAGLSASTINALIKANCKNENLLVNRADKIYKTIEKQLDFLRTIISKAKIEMSSHH